MSHENLVSSSFLASVNSTFVEELYARYLKNPNSVEPAWQTFFSELSDETPTVSRALAGASWSPRQDRIVGKGNGAIEAIAEVTGLESKIDLNSNNSDMAIIN